MILNTLLENAVSTDSDLSKQQFFTSCYEALYEKVYALTKYIVPLNAEDITSDIFKKIFELNLCLLLEHAEYLENYLLALARNHCYTVIRLEKHKNDKCSIEEALSVELSSNPMLKVDSMIDFNEALNNVTNKQKQVLELMLKGYRYEEIALQLNTSTGAIKNLVYRGKDSIRRFYQEKEKIPENYAP